MLDSLPLGIVLETRRKSDVGLSGLPSVFPRAHTPSDWPWSPIGPCGSARRPRSLVFARRPRSLAFARRSLKSSLPLAQSSGVEALDRRWAMGVAPSSVYHTVSQGPESDRGDETPAALSTRVPRTEAALNTTFTQERLQPEGVQWGRGNEIRPHLQDALLLYYDDVSSGPRPKAHWYMLTHECCSDTAPYWTPHRAAQSSGPYPRPLQRLNTSNHQVQSLSTKY